MYETEISKLQEEMARKAHISSKVIEFIKKWVAKEKVLINQLVQSNELLESEPELDEEEPGRSFDDRNESGI